MELFVVLAVHDDHFVIENEKGETQTVRRSRVDRPIEPDMPVLRARNGLVSPYEGAFFDEEDGVYKKLVIENGLMTLRERAAPKSQEEVRAFLVDLVRGDNPSLTGALDTVIEDLLSRGETELAFMLMNRQEAAAPSRSMDAMQSRYSQNRRETNEDNAKKRGDRTLNRA